MPNEVGGGPYREAGDPNAMALENMRKKIEGEGKHPILITENMKMGSKIPEFIKLIKNKVEPDRIVFYSIATGILKYYREIKTNPPQPGHEYSYDSPNFFDTQLWVKLDKKLLTAWISNLLTIAENKK